MALKKHAILSASSSARWLHCPPSAKLCAEIPDVTTDYAREGTCAHELCEYKVNKLIGVGNRDPTESLDFYDAEMESSTDEYALYVSEQIAKYVDPYVLVEQKLDFSRYVPDGFGTGDCVIIADKVLTVIDFKYGKGVPVSAENNSQMMLYALGALELFSVLYDISEVKMVIFQPRIENVSEQTITVDELENWAETILRPIAELAAKGEGEFCAGDHCRFCKVKATCRKRAEYILELAKYDFEEPVKLTDDEIEDILSKADNLVSWVNDVQEYALNESLKGRKWKHYKLVEGRSNRKYTDEKAVENKIKAAGYDPFEHKLMGITAMTKMLGKKKFDELLSTLVVKPQGKPTLAHISDKRPEWNTAADDFKEDSSL